MTIRFLTNSDFFISQSNQGPILSHRIPNISVVMYYSDKCPYCVQFKPVYINLSESLMNCSFAIANVSQYPLIVSLSKETITEIKYVPLIIIYINGNPYMEYSGNLDNVSLAGFITNVINSLNQPMSFQTQNKNSSYEQNTSSNHYASLHNNQKEINYSGLNCSTDTDGNIKCLRGNTKQKCYLTFEEAYSNNN